MRSNVASDARRPLLDPTHAGTSPRGSDALAASSAASGNAASYGGAARATSSRGGAARTGTLNSDWSLVEHPSTVKWFRHELWNVLSVHASKFGSPAHNFWSRLIEVTLLSLILANTTLIVLYSEEKLRRESSFQEAFLALEVLCLIVFTVEYLARLWSCVEGYGDGWRGRARWALKPLSVLDLIALAPFYVDTFTAGYSFTVKALQLIRVIAFFRLERQTKSIQRLVFVVRTRSAEFGVALFIAAGLLLVSATVMFYVEHEGQPQRFGSVARSLWWSMSAITTVGWGDAVPRTTGGQLVSSVTQLIAVVLFSLPAAIVSSGFIELMVKERAAKRRLRRRRALRRGHAAPGVASDALDIAAKQLAEEQEAPTSDGERIVFDEDAPLSDDGDGFSEDDDDDDFDDDDDGGGGESALGGAAQRFDRAAIERQRLRSEPLRRVSRTERHARIAASDARTVRVLHGTLQCPQCACHLALDTSLIQLSSVNAK